MQFCEILNHYIETLKCSAKDLSEASNISAATISRYRSGERIPEINSPQLASLAQGLKEIADREEGVTITSSEIFANFKGADNLKKDNIDLITSRINSILDTLGIKSSELAKALNYDSSYISRIRAKQRKPSDMATFIQKMCAYIVKKYATNEDKHKVAILLAIDANTITNQKDYELRLIAWCNTKKSEEQSQIMHFLQTMDAFNLEEYIDTIHFNDIKIPTVPFQFSTSKNYFGLEEMQKGELDFLKATVLSSSTEPVILCSDMPMGDMATSKDFMRKWMFGIVAILKKGNTIKMIHNLDRPYNELMLGLEGWIPIYMTGQVEPYYHKKVKSAIYGHLHYTSGSAALFGECIVGHHDTGRYYLTKKKEEISQLKLITSQLLEKASPLMRIYKYGQRREFHNLLADLLNNHNPIRQIYSSIPIYTMTDDLLQEILVRNMISPATQQEICSFVSDHRKSILERLKNYEITDEIKLLSKEEFDDNPPCLGLSSMFFGNLGKSINYTYEEYIRHIEQMIEFSNNKDNYHIVKSERMPFRNIQITIQSGKCVIVSKNTHPAIHFVIYHPILRDALENMAIAVEDEV